MKRLSPLLVCIILVACTASAPSLPEPAGLTFVHLNDTYRMGAVEDGKAGGFGRVLSIIRALQAQGRDVRVLHAGDFLYPSLESSLWHGEQMVEALNFMDAIAPLYAVAGNHEFDPRTPESLINAIKASQFDWLGDNYEFNTGDAATDTALRNAFTIEHGGKTIGIFALTVHADDGGNDRDYVPIDKDYTGIAEKTIEHFEAIGVDAIIGLTHIHVSQDREIARLHSRHPRFVLVAGGHDHEPEYTPASAASATVVKGASNARVIWTIDLDFDTAGRPVIAARKVKLDEGVAVDPDFQAFEDKWRRLLIARYPFLEARVGTAAVSMDAREETVRRRESSWADFIADQMRGAFGSPEADLAFINGGTLRIDDFIEDDIRFEDIGRTFGFSSFLRLTTVTGAEFRHLMEAGYRGVGGAQGYFPQVSGFRVCVDRRRKEGNRIVSLQVPDEEGWAEIIADKQYRLVVPDFLFGGGDGYQIPKNRPVSRPASELIYLVLDAVLDAQGRGASVGKAVDDSNRRYDELGRNRETCFQ